MKDIKKLEINATHIIFISDIHFGKHVNSEEWQNNMKEYFYKFFIPQIKSIKASLKEDEKLICINLGDTYDDRKAIDINVNNLCIDVCEDIAKEVEYYVLNGNHDLAKKTNEGNSSLRSLEYIPNLTLINEPTLININYASKKKTNIIAIPYLGDAVLETQYLADYSTKAKYALMHTELTRMKMDNGMLITSGCNPDMFKGMILSGHIHRRQENKHIIYVGSPYHLGKSDIGDEKGVYILSLSTNKFEFIKNNISPIYHTITIEKYSHLTPEEKQAFFNNNYNYILIPEEELPKWKKVYDVYNLGDNTTAKFSKPIIAKHKMQISIDVSNNYKEMSIEELINESIDQSESIDSSAKERLKNMSAVYLKDAESKLSMD